MKKASNNSFSLVTHERRGLTPMDSSCSLLLRSKISVLKSRLVLLIAVLAIFLSSPSRAFLLPVPSSPSKVQLFETSPDPYGSTSSSTTKDPTSSIDDETDDDSNPHHLTPELLKIATAFQTIGDDKLRYKQLLFMANQVPTIDPSACVPENKVPGCLSTVYIDASASRVGNNDAPLISFTGDSDGVLTKGLVALLIRGLSGATAADIDQVDPAFIETTGIAASLTPGRNNGFLNMLAVMKRKAWQAEATYTSSISSAVGDDGVDLREEENDSNQEDCSIYSAMLATLTTSLQPTQIKLDDVSHQHAGHVEGGGTESHFELYVVSDAFLGLNLIKRHKLVYNTLGDIMPKIHALQIQAKTPEEVSEA